VWAGVADRYTIAVARLSVGSAGQFKAPKYTNSGRQILDFPRVDDLT
jgi:hypothetical protein